MAGSERYTPGPASGARIQKNSGQNHRESAKEGKWTLILVRELHHSPEEVWKALTDPAHLRDWAPFDADGSLDAIGPVKLTWVGNPKAIET